jgi:hypothetical protein
MDVTFCWPPAQDKCGHGLSMPSRVKPKIMAYHLCQITINPVLSCKFEKWCEFSSHIKTNSHEKKMHKMRPTCLVLNMKLAQAASGPLIAFQNVALTYTALVSLFCGLVTSQFVTWLLLLLLLLYIFFLFFIFSNFE